MTKEASLLTRITHAANKSFLRERGRNLKQRAWVNKADNRGGDTDHLWRKLQHSLSQLSPRTPAFAEPASYHSRLQNISPGDRTLVWSGPSSGSGKCQPGGACRNYSQLTLNAGRTFLQWTFWIVSWTWRMRQVNIFKPTKLWICFCWKKRKKMPRLSGECDDWRVLFGWRVRVCLDENRGLNMRCRWLCS